MRRYSGLYQAFMIISVILVFCATFAPASTGAPYQLDEVAGSLTVTGEGHAPAGVQSPAQARLMAERAAIVDAYGTAARLLSEALPKAASSQAEYSVFLRGGRISRSDVEADGSVKVVLEVPLSPELAGEVREVLRRHDAVASQEGEAMGIRHEESVARRRVHGPRVITRREWIDRYQAGTWVPYKR